MSAKWAPTDRRARTVPASDSPAERGLAAKFVRAYGSGDVGTLVASLIADVRVATPPIPSSTTAATSWHASTPASSARTTNGRTRVSVHAHAGGEVQHGPAHGRCMVRRQEHRGIGD